MPLFNNWPWIDLSKLNLDYILSKIKVVEDAELDAQKVLTAAADILPKVDQVNSDADRAEAAAAAAAASAQLASEKCDLAENAATECAGYESSAEASATAAAGSAASANASKLVAEQAVDDCQTALTGCQASAAAAEQSRIRAEAAADRAESASSTTGYRAYTGVLAASTLETLLLPDGTYQLDWFANDTNNSSAIYLLFKSGTMLTYRNIHYNGDGDTGMLIGSTETAITMRNDLGSDQYWFITGCEAV